MTMAMVIAISEYPTSGLLQVVSHEINEMEVSSVMGVPLVITHL